MAIFGGPESGEHGLAELRGYWEALRVGGGLPERDRIDPRGMAGVLDRCFLAERIAPGLARLRLAGAALCDMIGMELRGMPLSALFLPEARMRLAAALEPVFAAPAILDARVEGEGGWGRPALRARLVLLPLTNAGGAVDVALGAICLPGETGRAPRRLDLGRVLHERLAGVGTPLVAPVAAFAEAPRPWRAPPGRAHLRLVKNE